MNTFKKPQKIHHIYEVSIQQNAAILLEIDRICQFVGENRYSPLRGERMTDSELYSILQDKVWNLIKAADYLKSTEMTRISNANLPFINLAKSVLGSTLKKDNEILYEYNGAKITISDLKKIAEIEK